MYDAGIFPLAWDCATEIKTVWGNDKATYWFLYVSTNKYSMLNHFVWFSLHRNFMFYDISHFLYAVLFTGNKEYLNHFLEQKQM